MKRARSLRYFHERTGAALPAYVLGDYVIEKARRDWDARGYRGSAGNPRHREWWEVRRQHSRGKPGASFGPLLHEANTLRECRAWVEGQT